MFARTSNAYATRSYRIRCLWDHLDRLVTNFDEKGLNEGIAVRVSYKSSRGKRTPPSGGSTPCSTKDCATTPTNSPRDRRNPAYLPARLQTNTGTVTSKDPPEGGDPTRGPTSSANGTRQRGLQRGDPTRTACYLCLVARVIAAASVEPCVICSSRSTPTSRLRWLRPVCALPCDVP